MAIMLFLAAVVVLVPQQPTAAAPPAAVARMTFASKGAPVVVGPMAGRPVLADFDGDGALDVAVACGTCCGSQPDPRSGHIAVLLGDGRGGLRPAMGSPHKLVDSTRKLAAGDVDEDGKLDLVAAAHSTDEFTVLFGDGRGGFAAGLDGPRPLGPTNKPHTHDVALVDLDGDGHLDVLATQSNANRLAVARGRGNGAFAAPTHVTIARHPYDAIAALDFDGDGRRDVAVPDLFGKAVTVSLQRPDGTFASILDERHRQFATAERPGYLAAGDLDGDGDADLAVAHDDQGLVVTLQNDGRGGFAPFAGSPLRLPAMAWGLALVDLDGDGVLDLAVGSDKDRVFTAPGLGNGSFAAPAAWAAGSRSLYVAAGDLDGDGRPDLVASSYDDGVLTVLLAARP